MNLSEIRATVRSHTDLPDEDDIPTALLDTYIREGFDRTMAHEERWPFFESAWSVANAAGAAHIVLPSDAEQHGVMTLREVDSFRLQQIPHDYADEMFSSTAAGARPAYFSAWGGNLYLWPVPNSERNYSMRGYRKPTDWVSTGAATEADGDERLHSLYVWYACSLTYAFQEDEVLEATYMTRWQQGLVDIHSKIMAPYHGRPAVLSKGLSGGHVGTRWSWDLP